MVYLWLMLNITNDALAGLKARIKMFSQKGLSRMYPLLGCDKHSPGSGPLWGVDRAKFPALYNALVGAPDGAGRKEKRDSWARVLCVPTSMKRVRRRAPMYNREGHPLATQ